ncbi:TetR/AcrR family transcriptional regulator [Dactylosporangium roseum]|uniref:TetR/AcrR family transcriptional regulator n=1 Tax=Dactylosporangium roseum TaxID=47989 RepID=A0ABY5Z6J4_9ACTN|nr:TetR/AcrR family transcriptional regulator [Dactylosporangium roseum]UWZ36348.1 TetR/AcrR family transcriptional regulator [Dactylosporangium roseum]
MGRRKIIEDGQLLAKARDIFMREGIAVGSRQIAQEIGISSSVLFQRFGSKEDLFFAAMTPPAPDLAALLTRDDADDPAEARLARIAAGLLDYFRQLAPVLAALSTHPAFHYPTFAERHPDAALETLTGELMAALTEQHHNGEIDCPDPGPVVLNLIATAYALAMFERIGVHNGQFDHSTVDALTRVLWHGIAPAAGTP